jgi:signal transduction histidine kinase/tetratricopeptide (TPR) repeat protein
MTTRVLGRRYEITALLKSGLGIETLLGSDLHTRELVVLKQTALAEIPPGAQLRLEHEAHVLRELASPWIAPLLDVGRDGQVLYLVMPFVPGITIAERIARGGPLSVPDALTVGRGVMRALEAAHERGVLHRDVKPANVIVGAGSPLERVTLVDFGLARSGHLDASLRDVPVGSVAYVSPEQAGLIHSEVAERSDLYSAGGLLFECLAGRRPLDGATVADVLRQHLTARPPSLRRLGLPVPRALDELVQRLLAKNPRDRYQSARAVLADLDEIASALERGVREPAVAIGSRDAGRALTEPVFVGRDDERRVFDHAIAGLADGGPRLILVEGDSGAGKTRLLDEVAVLASQHGAWVLRGQSSDRAARRPLQILDRLVDEVAAAGRAEPPLGDALRARLGEHLDAARGALPQLTGILGPAARRSLGPEAFGEGRTLTALAALIDALGTPARPAVILLDDCQWLDELSLKLLDRWHREHEAEERRSASVLLVAAYRSEDVPEESLLQRLLPAARLALKPLGPDEVRRMAESIAGALPSAAIELLERLSEGNPFLAGAVLEGLVEGGALVDTPAGWQLQPQAMAEAQSSRRAAAFLAQRLDKLPPPVLHLLSVGALLGKSFELRLAADLAGQSGGEAMAAVGEARRRHVAWIDPGGTRCTFVHDRLRDAVLERLSPAERRRLHRVAAATLERTEVPGPDRDFDLAYHFDAAGDHARALPYALSAAEQARAHSALEIAERYYRIAERGAGDEEAGAEGRRRVAGGLGDVLLLRGRYDEAGACFAQALELSESALDRAGFEGKIGELAFKRGDVPAASDALERALALLGRSVPRSALHLAVATLVQVLVQVAHSLWPRLLVGRRRLEGCDADLLAARIFSRLAYANWFRRGQVATFWAHLSGMNLAERYPPTRERAQAYSEHSISVTGLPRVFFARGVRYAERGLAIRRDLGDVWGQGQSLNFHGMLLHAFGRYDDALAKASEALRVLRRTGDRWEANIAAVHIASCHFRLGALREAIAESRRVHREGLEIDDLHAMAIVLEIWAKASGGAVPAELVEAALRRSEGDPQSRETVLQAEGVRRIGAGRPQEAVTAFAAAEEVARSANLRSEYVSYIATWAAQARRIAAVQAIADAGVVLPGQLHEAETALRRGLRSARRYRGNLPMALRERALLDTMRGRLRRARRHLDASLAEAERQGARFEAFQTLLARGEIGRRVGWPGAEAEAARARSALHEMGAAFACHPLRALPPEQDPRPVTLSLADRFTSIVDEGRRIASALTPDDVHAALCVAASVLLRGEASLVVAVDGDEPRVSVQVGGPVAFSRSAVERAVRERRPVIVADPLEGPAAESLVLANLRSALCAPIEVDGRPVGCLYVAHGLVGDLFDADEERIAGYLTTLAGASLERATTFAALQALSHTLEQRVEERTSELRAANAELDANLRRLRETQDQLVQAAKMAAVGTLVAGLSHELNNPLGVILGYAQTHLRSMPPGEPARAAMTAIERQARRCAELVATLLDFSRKRPSDREEISLETLVRRVVTLATLKVRRHDVRLELEMPPPDACRVRVSPTQIESALLNLVDNAADASPSGAAIQIEAVACPRASRRGVEVRVRDHGAGIERDVLPRIFDPFFTTKPVGQGTGLGLPLARQFIEGHGGELSVESRPGEGTTVLLWLPTCEQPSERASAS